MVPAPAFAPNLGLVSLNRIGALTKRCASIPLRALAGSTHNKPFAIDMLAGGGHSAAAAGSCHGFGTGWQAVSVRFGVVALVAGELDSFGGGFKGGAERAGATLGPAAGVDGR